jgi:hypothetical protein
MSIMEVESWLRILREALPGAGRDGRPAPVRKLSKRFLEQAQSKRSK